MRGKLLMSAGTTGAGGITPADAGKTLFKSFPRVFIQDHPRRCGENNAAARAKIAQIGSPPQMRGKLKLYCEIPACWRITPADAGKTI